jgi:hypothetical protein
MVEWRWLGTAEFREPFFVETVQLALNLPFALLFPRETSIDTLGDLEPGPEPNGFILHMSRCGSTLVTQMLSAVPEHLVISEPLLVNDVLRFPGTDDERARRLRLVVGALGSACSGGGRGYVLKLDPWLTHDLPVIRRAFPKTPWLFVSRDPVEVLVSHMRQPGVQMFPNVVPPELFGLDLVSAAPLSFEEYGAIGLGAICRDALAARDEHALFLDYGDLPDAVFDQVLDWFQLDCDADARAAMEAASHRDAKLPSRPFIADSAAKRREVTPEMRNAIERWAAPAYRELSSGSGRSRTAK